MNAPAPQIPDLSAIGLTPWPSPAGPVAGYVVQVYRTDPGKPLPSPIPDYADWELVVAGYGSGDRGYAMYRSPRVNPAAPGLTKAPTAPAPAVTPAPPERPSPPPSPPSRGESLPPLAVYVATADNAPTPPASYSVNHTADQVMQNLSVSGYRFGAVAQAYKGGLTIRNCRFLDSHSDNQFEGSGIYASAIPGPIVVTDCVSAFNGRPRSIPGYTPTLFRHGHYGQGDAAAPSFVRTVFARNANAGPQLRNAGKCSDCLMAENGTGVLAVMGRVELERCLILGSSLYFDGLNFTGGSALVNYGQVKMTDCLIVAQAGQNAGPPVSGKPAAGLYPQPCIVSGGTWFNNDHPTFIPPPPGVPLVTGSGNVVVGWPTPVFGGQRPHDGSGFTVLPNPIPPFDWMTPVGLAIDNKITVAEAIARVRAGVRAAVLVANPGSALS